MFFSEHIFSEKRVTSLQGNINPFTVKRQGVSKGDGCADGVLVNGEGEHTSLSTI